MKQESIRLVYIDDDREEALSAYLDDSYRNEVCDIHYDEVSFQGERNYEDLLQNPVVISANVILIDSLLFENDQRLCTGKFSGEEFRMILRKIFPFIEVLVISQNGENMDYDIIPKYQSGGAESSTEYYDRVLKAQLDERIERVRTFRNISQKLEFNTGIDKFLVEKTMNSLNGITEYDGISKADVDALIEAFQSLK